MKNFVGPIHQFIHSLLLQLCLLLIGRPNVFQLLKMSDEAVQQPKVYVMGLSVDTQEDDLRKVFDGFGDIKDIYIKPKDTFAFAFVTYYEMDHATRAVSDANGQNVCGKRIKCDLARPRNRNNNGPRGGPGGNRQQGGSRACFKCQQEGHFARECPNAEAGDNRNDRRGGYNNNGGNGGNYSNNNNGGRNDYNNRGGNDYNNNRGSNNNDRGSNNNNRGSNNNERNRSRSKSRSHSPKRNNNTNHTQKRSVSRSHSRSPIRNKNMQQRRPSPTRSDSCKRKNSRSRSRSVEKKKTTVRRRSPSHSRSRS